MPLADLRAGIAKLTFEERVGSMADRADRIRDAAALAEHVSLDVSEGETVSRASELAKFDLASQMVVELSSLAGYMAREYALKAGETPEVAAALYEMEQPRTAGGAPESRPGALLALADRFDLLMAMFRSARSRPGHRIPSHCVARRSASSASCARSSRRCRRSRSSRACTPRPTSCASRVSR